MLQQKVSRSIKSNISQNHMCREEVGQKIQTLPNLLHSGRSGASQNESTIPLCMYIQGSQIEVQFTTHWNLIGHSMTTPSPVLFPSSILWLHLSHCAFIPTRKNWMHISKMLLFYSFFFTFYKLCKSADDRTIMAVQNTM